MGTTIKPVISDSSTIEVKADSKLAIHNREAQSDFPQSSRTMPFPKSRGSINSAEVSMQLEATKQLEVTEQLETTEQLEGTEQSKVSDRLKNHTHNKTIKKNITPAQARWLAIGENMGTLLARLRVWLFG